MRNSKRSRNLDEGNAYTTAILAYAYSALGQRAKARLLVQHLEHWKHVYPAAVAVAYIGLGETNRAIEWLERARDERSTALVLLDIDPIFDSLRSQPRFQALVNEMNFPQ